MFDCCQQLCQLEFSFQSFATKPSTNIKFQAQYNEPINSSSCLLFIIIVKYLPETHNSLRTAEFESDTFSTSFWYGNLYIFASSELFLN